MESQSLIRTKGPTTFTASSPSALAPYQLDGALAAELKIFARCEGRNEIR